MIYETIATETIETIEERNQKLIAESRRDQGFVTIPKIKLREIQKIAREINQFYIVAMIEDLLR